MDSLKNRNEKTILKIQKVKKNISQRKQRAKSGVDLNRNYACECGKKYLSYAALYTHYKNKHKSNKNKENKTKNYENTQNNQSIINDIQIFFQRNTNEKIENNNNNNYQYIIDDNYIKHYFKLNEQYNQIFSSFQHYIILIISSDSEQQQQNDYQNNSFFANKLLEQKLYNIYQTLATFIIQVSVILNPQQLIETAVFVILLLKCLNEYGEESCVDQINYNNTNNKSKDFCQANTSMHAAQISNMFITEILPEYFNKDVINLDELKVIGPDINGMKNSCYLMKIIINWMYVNKFSNAKIIFDWQQYKLEHIYCDKSTQKKNAKNQGSSSNSILRNSATSFEENFLTEQFEQINN